MMEIYTVVIDDKMEARAEFASASREKALEFIAEAAVEKLEKEGKDFTEEAVSSAKRSMLTTEDSINTFIKELPGISVIHSVSDRGDDVWRFYDNGFFFLKETLQKIFIDD